MTAQQLQDFLEALEKAIPPGEGRHHSITFNQYGSDLTGWDNRLGLNVWVPLRVQPLPPGSSVQTFFIDEEDIVKAAETIACIKARTDLEDKIVSVRINEMRESIRERRGRRSQLLL